jgi:hypothetical protein
MAKLDKPSTIIQFILFMRPAALRQLPANGSRSRPSATGNAPLPNGFLSGCAADWVGKVTSRIAFVVAAPADSVDGEKTAVAAVGNPVTLRLTAPGIPVLPSGEITNG